MMNPAAAVSTGDKRDSRSRPTAPTDEDAHVLPQTVETEARRVKRAESEGATRRAARRARTMLFVVLALLSDCTSRASHSSPPPGAVPCASSYDRYACRTCHGDTGRGAADLRHAAAHFRSDREIEAWIRHPSRVRPGTAMPDYDGVILEADYPSLVRCVHALGTDAQ